MGKYRPKLWEDLYVMGFAVALIALLCIVSPVLFPQGSEEADAETTLDAGDDIPLPEDQAREVRLRRERERMAVEVLRFPDASDRLGPTPPPDLLRVVHPDLLRSP